MPKIKGSLSKKAVLERLKVCEEPEVVNEIYTFGQLLLRETLQNLHSLDSKAVWMAGYGAAIITFLVSSSTTWATLGNRWTVGIAVLAGVSGFVGALFAVNSLSLQSVDWIGDEEWLEKDCLASVWKLKRYRIFIMSGTINSIDDVNVSKARALRKAQWGLSTSVGFLLTMLLHLGWLRVLRGVF